MRLESEGGLLIEYPTDELLREALADLANDSNNSFAILERRDKPPEYLQALGGPEAFILEYHEGGQHYRATDEKLPFDMAVALFSAYNRGDDWRPMVEWQDVTVEIMGRPVRPLTRAMYVLLLVVFVALLAALTAVIHWTR